jgi:hypothetical protein
MQSECLGMTVIEESESDTLE